MGDTERRKAATELVESQRLKRRKMFEVHEEICRRLGDSENRVASQPGFKDELLNHFDRFPSFSYALGLNVEHPEDVIMHMKLLHRARDPTTRPAFEVRVMQVPVSDVSCGETFHSTRNVNPQTSDGSTSSLLTDAFVLSPSLKLALEAKESNGGGDGNGGADGELHFFQHFYKITISTVDKPKLLCQLTSLLTEIGLHIQEIHAFSTSDGYSLIIFVGDGWPSEEMEQLKDVLKREIPKIENQPRVKQFNQNAFDKKARKAAMEARRVTALERKTGIEEKEMEEKIMQVDLDLQLKPASQGRNRGKMAKSGAM